MKNFPRTEMAFPYWHAAWISMWRSIGYARERSTWDTMKMWSV